MLAFCAHYDGTVPSNLNRRESEMSMSKKDYEMIADVLTTCPHDDMGETILQLAWRFSQENPNFRWDLFLEASDYTGDYEIDRFGVIRSPGKFEGENCYMLIAHETYLNGWFKELDERLIEVRFPWGGQDKFRVVFHEDNEGFLWEQHGEAGENHDQ